MCSSARGASLVAALALAALAACGGSSDTALPATATSIEPACASNAAAAQVVIRGTMPVKATVSMSGSSGTLQTGYRLWLGDIELADVTWVDASTLRATVPPGIAPGTYTLAVESPFGERTQLEGAFRVASGACNPTGAGLVITADARPASLSPGERVVVAATVTNSGDARANGVGTAVSAPPGFTVFTADTDALDIPVGESRSFTWTYTASAGAGRGTFTVTAAGVDSLNGQSVTAPQFTTNEVAVTYGVGGTVTGLSGTGLVLRMNGADVPVSGNGPVTLGSLASGSSFDVTIAAQPSSPAQTCNVSGGTGTVGTGPVTSIVVNCAVNTFTVGGSVTGLSGSGLVLHDSVSNQDVSVTAAGTYAFATPIRSGAQYSVTVRTQPSVPTQSCTVANGSGTVATANVTNVNVTCQTASFTVGGAVSGLTGTGLVLRLDNTTNVSIPANATSYAFSTPIPSGTQYTVSIASEPSGPTQTCTLQNATGTVGAANVANVNVSCSTNSYAISGTIAGYTGSGLVLHNGTENLPIPAGATSFAFQSQVPSGGAYAVSVSTQPTSPSQTCVVSNGAGTVSNANVTTVAVTCQTNSFTVGGTAMGLAGSGLALALNGGTPVPVTANGSFTLGTLQSGVAYAVSVSTQPTNPAQTCSVSAGTGTVTTANVTSVVVNCATNSYTVSGTISGYAGSGLVLHNGSENLTVNAGATSFAFTTTVQSGSSYAVTVATQPTNPSQTCVVANGSGTVATANVTNVAVTCTTSAFTVGGTITGLSGSGLQLHESFSNQTFSATSSGSYAFATALQSGAQYSVSVQAQPSNPAQTCVVQNATGAVGAGNVTNVNVVCTTNSYTVGGTLSGLLGNRVVLQMNGTSLTLTADGAFTFSNPVASGAAYSVSVTAQPKNPSQTCNVAGGTGTIGAANVTTVTVTCSTSSFTVGGSVTGLAGTGLTLQETVSNQLASITANGSWAFPTPIASGSAYNAVIVSQPTGQTCTIAAGTGSGTVLDANVTSVSVSCTTLSYSLTVDTALGTGTGSLLCNDQPCATSYPAGTNLTLTAAPAAGSAFVGWTIDGSTAVCAGTGPCPITMSSDHAVGATFDLLPPPI